VTTWRVRLDSPGGVRPLLVEGDPAAPRGDLIGALGAVGWSADTVHVDGQPWHRDDAQPIGGALQHGARLGTGPADRTTLTPGYYVVVLGGPASGRSTPLTPDTPVVVGRSLGIDDALLSGVHCEFRLGTDGTVTVRDLGSRNGTTCDGGLVTGTPVVLGPAARVHAGASLIGVVELSDTLTLLGNTATGRTVQRPFREALPALSEPPTAPSPAAGHTDDGAGGAWLRALVPIVTAAGMALLTGRWWFLAIGALSPVVYAYDSLRRARRRRHAQASESARHAQAQARFEQALCEYRAAETCRARQRHGGGGMAAVQARFGHRSVWERRPGDADFGRVTLGHAALPSACQADRVDAPEPVRLWNVPLTVDLTREGPLGITGPTGRGRAVARALLADLVTAHAPTDVHVWVLAGTADAWSFAQWLPHVFAGGGSARLATTPEGCAALVQSLRSLVDARREQAAGRTAPSLPLHVVFVDGVATLADSDLADLLRDGPPVGIVTVVVDAGVVPEGIRGEVRLGAHADECEFRSVLTPRIDAVAVAELVPDVALAAALALAPLDSYGTGDHHRPLGSVHLTDLLALGDRTPAEQAAFWQAHSPCTNVPVGITVDGVPLRLDIVRHGPHGLVGGMTRSGKTEFLKSWFAALALHNHPDDLAIAIVDFKGGVDHQALVHLPHVVALATNQDIDLFERTLTLLTAEHERRQRLFTDVAGVATIEGYRTARQARPELPPVPRLLVVVDEFAELLDSPDGRAQLGRLEQTSRIGAGLGVHLVLLTQLFDHALPPTIDAQAGLRVCFKVQQAEHSNVVLKSPAAASIGSATKGRGFVRVQGGELVEFQAARVGNEAPGVTVQPSLTARWSVLATVAHAASAATAREVPNELQDLHRVVELVRHAAALDPACAVGRALPWPGELPQDVTVDELEHLSLPGERSQVPIGLADDPARQRRVALAHHFGDDVVLYAGAPGSGHHDALVATSCQLARHHRPDDVHLYGIDTVGHGLAQVAGLGHTGAVATRDDATALRILHHLVTEAARRKGAPADGPRIVLFVLGLERLFLHAEGTLSPLLAPLTTLVNEVPGTRIQVVCSGSPAMLANRVGLAAGRRLVFGAHDPLEYPPAVPRALRAQLTAPGRCVDLATGLLAQAVAVSVPEPRPAVSRPPRTFTRAPWPLPLGAVGEMRVAAGNPGVPVGIVPDTGELLWLDPAEDGMAYRIMGPPKSGRSNALAAIGTLAARCGWDVLVSVASRRSPLAAGCGPWGRPVPVAELPEWVGERIVRPTVVLVDDAHRLDDDYPWRKLTAVETAPVVTFVAGATDGLSRPLGVVRTLGATGGVVLMPTRSRDADTLGLRTLADEWLVQPLPGIGVAAIAGEPHRLQFPLTLCPGDPQ